MSTPCFLLEPTDDARRWLRRYVSTDHAAWTCAEGWHEARALIENGTVVPGDHPGTVRDEEDVEAYAGDPRWPTHCEQGCGYAFTEDDHRQLFTRRIYRVAAVMPGAALQVGEILTLEDAPAGAMWYADWIGEWAQGPDGRSLVAVVPGGHQWMIDGQASNCTRPGDRTHKCWVRHGTPPDVTVDKNGETCAAGAGSIMANGYHGFLRGGAFT